MFHFVSSEEELYTSIIAPQAWVQGATKPQGAIMLSDIRNDIAMLKQEVAAERQARIEAYCILGYHVARINNLLREKGLLERNMNRSNHEQ